MTVRSSGRTAGQVPCRPALGVPVLDRGQVPSGLR
jgi:hypothetical protein